MLCKKTLKELMCLHVYVRKHSTFIDCPQLDGKSLPFLWHLLLIEVHRSPCQQAVSIQNDEHTTIQTAVLLWDAFHIPAVMNTSLLA